MYAHTHTYTRTTSTTPSYQLKQILSPCPPSSNTATGWGHDSCQVDGVNWFITAIAFTLPNQLGPHSLMNLWLFITWGHAFLRFTSHVFSSAACRNATHVLMMIFLIKCTPAGTLERFIFHFLYRIWPHQRFCANLWSQPSANNSVHWANTTGFILPAIKAWPFVSASGDHRGTLILRIYGVGPLRQEAYSTPVYFSLQPKVTFWPLEQRGLWFLQALSHGRITGVKRLCNLKAYLWALMSKKLH